jgi:hypothetical protein
LKTAIECASRIPARQDQLAHLCAQLSVRHPTQPKLAPSLTKSVNFYGIPAGPLPPPGLARQD